MSEKNRVYCLYRVSTDKQVDYTSNHEADIPMQRKACHRFAEKMGWEIIHEEQEDGVSGHKVRAENRDKLQLIKEHALQKRFDILLVFMFDRIGRIADETPFVVEWFVKNGIQVWSTQEGEQRFDNHIDKLLNYIRFWQADGESVKTSLRTKTSLGQMVEEGHFKGGMAAYGYDLVKSGRVNKKKHELYDLQINEDEAPVVRIIFDKYVNEGYGPQRIATFLNEHGYRARTGKLWHHATVRGILCNLTYTGVLRCGESRSDVLQHLQIIPPEQFRIAQEIRAARSNQSKSEYHVPQNTRGKALLAGNVYCAHCGARLVLTTNGKGRRLKNGTVDNAKRVRYICYGKTRKQTACTGPTGYTQHIVDGIVENLVKDIFRKVERVPRQAIVEASYDRELSERKRHLEETQTLLADEEKKLSMLKSEIVRCLEGKSAFSQKTLASLIEESETTCAELQNAVSKAEREYSDRQTMYETLLSKYDELISWAQMYDTASIEAKKMIVNELLVRVEVSRDYKINAVFRLDFEQFISGLEIAA